VAGLRSGKEGRDEKERRDERGKEDKVSVKKERLSLQYFQ